MTSKYFPPHLYYPIWVSWETNISAWETRNYCPFYIIVLLMHWLILRIINVFLIITEKKRIQNWCSMRTARKKSSSRSSGGALHKKRWGRLLLSWEKETTPTYYFGGRDESKCRAILQLWFRKLQSLMT